MVLPEWPMANELRETVISGPGREFPREESPPRHARIDHELDDYEPDNGRYLCMVRVFPARIVK